MSKLSALHSNFTMGKIPKSSYISKMHKIHARLFEYSHYIPTTDIRKIEIKDELVILTSRKNNIQMVCDPLDERIAPIEILNFTTYEKEEIDMIISLAPVKPIIFDIGANIGWYSFTLSKQIQGSQIHAFEPMPNTYKYLVRNTKLNNLANIHLYNFGFSDKIGSFDFYFYPEGSGNASMAHLTSQKKVEKIRCKLKTLDNFCSQSKILPDFIKCDVEGAELFVFKGGCRLIQGSTPIIFTEMLRKWSKKFGYHPNDIISFFQQLDYHCFYISGNKIKQIKTVDFATVPTNFFFLHKKKHQEQIKKFQAK
ncbi:FkbM family methyltransferase [Candidatus Roizmanbacteria bacterium CG_4_9_14_0_2_um_filter_39_13]|uniref:FkbM family methyltransferase n=2 Tax=Candidatus Roizmaniibacteriota TaxID=1752723 RepID=A0A2M8EY73_9BACT|nr:MAG: FkbM family methyltransferase [Candidatus Roizmanbacteria bacterium CG_4_9_14_0_2_um_filter_39_13]PJE61892.1 MAG: FkbM family methyltransferase [Candidatus Roizmanbacteria bacterium CG10_big_fil_rev_8_21_14_0_10_39_12]